ncbi:MAG: DUF5397 domain-containing protein [Neomegalonema sp.]|nr:DUF5397 domain-containing protein [Neomegalonema sp.]
MTLALASSYFYFMNKIPPRIPATNAPLDSLIGGFRRFGEMGPAYVVLDIKPDTAGAGSAMALIRVLESGEILDYALPKLLADPQA